MTLKTQQAGKFENSAEEQKVCGTGADDVLIQQVREIAGGANIHKAENLIGAYAAAVGHYRLTGDSEFLKLASDGERALRIFLVKNRLRRCVGNILQDYPSAA